jgi:hypothetical protein
VSTSDRRHHISSERFSFAGVALLYLILRCFAYLLIETLNLKGFESGKYGSPPSMLYWTRQAAVYVLSLTTMKLLVILLLAIFPGIYDIGEWLLNWTWTGEGDALQVILYAVSFGTLVLLH